MPNFNTGSGRGRNTPDNEEKGKLFVGGLSWEITQDTLQRYFSGYGEVVDCVVMKNNETGRSRGFGFITFADPANVDLVLKNGPHQLDGRTIDPKACNPRSMQKPRKNVNWPKIFLGGLPANLTETDLRTFFSKYGKVTEVVIMYDQEKKKSRGFGFLSFETEESVEACTQEHFVNIHGKQVEVKKAEPRDAPNKMGGDPTGNMPPQSQWGPAPPGGPPMGMANAMGPMGAPNGQLGGPMGGPPLGPMGSGLPPAGMLQGYQGWNPTQQQGYPPQGYGAPQGPQGYQGWGPAPGPQGQQMPPQWGANYGGPPQQQGYGAYGPPQGGSWNWSVPQNGPPAPGGPAGPNRGPPGTQGDPYGRPVTGQVGQPGPAAMNAALSAAAAGPPVAPGTTVGTQQKTPGNDFTNFQNQFGSMGSYPPQPETRGFQELSQGTTAGYTHPVAPPQGPPDLNYGNANPSYTATQAEGTAPSGGYAGGPGPQRGGSYGQAAQGPSYHPYRR